MDPIKPIHTEEDLQNALREIEALWGAPLGTPEGDRLDVLATLVEVYEDKHYPIPASDPVELLRFAIEDMGRTQAELAELLGSRSRASEILSRKRALTKEQAHAISVAWKLPLGVLAVPYALAGAERAPEMA